MDNAALKAMAKQFGFAECCFFDPPQPNMQSEAVIALLVFAYQPYTEHERIPAYYINSNIAYHAMRRLIDALAGLGISAQRVDLPMKGLVARGGMGERCLNSLVSIEPYGTRTVLQCLLINGDFCAEYQYDEKRDTISQYCLHCRACIKACPCGAIGEHGLDVQKCMRWHMEASAYPEWVYDIQTTHIGCEVCQYACPRNALLKRTAPTDEIRSAFDLLRLASGDTAEARKLVGRNITGGGKLTLEAKHFLRRQS